LKLPSTRPFVLSAGWGNPARLLISPKRVTAASTAAAGRPQKSGQSLSNRGDELTVLGRMSDLKAQILQAIRDFNGELDWRHLADKVGIEPSYSDGLLGFHEAVTALHHGREFRLEFDEQGTVRFFIDSN
jgi:hypothetical protein